MTYIDNIDRAMAQQAKVSAREAFRFLHEKAAGSVPWDGVVPCVGAGAGASAAEAADVPATGRLHRRIDGPSVGASFVDVHGMVVDKDGNVYRGGVPMGTLSTIGLEDAAVDIDNLVTLYPDTSNRTGFVVLQGDHTQTPSMTVKDLKTPVLAALEKIPPPLSLAADCAPMCRTSGLPPTEPTHTYGGVVARRDTYFLVNNLGYIIMEYEQGQWLLLGISHQVSDKTPVLECAVVVWNGHHGVHTRTVVLPLASPGLRGMLAKEVVF